MKPDKTERRTSSAGVIASASFGISRPDEAHLMGILRDQLYSDKILAVVREYTSNAWDANRQVPIEVHLPVEGDLEFRVRDHGPGLTRQEVFEVFTQYGASTKRESDDGVGMLGIGCKSAFCYVDSFTVTSWKDGTKSIYICALDQSERGVCNLVHEEPCALEDTGVQVTVQVKEKDCAQFTTKGVLLLRYISPTPVVNESHGQAYEFAPITGTELPSGLILPHGDATDHEGRWKAVMGCVPYKIDLGSLGLTDHHKCLYRLSGVLKFEIGELQIAASREALAYKPKTVAAIVARFDSLIDEYIAKVIDDLASLSISDWERRIKTRVARDFDLPLTDDWDEHWGKAWVKIGDEDLPFVLQHGDNATNQITIHEATQILIDDTGKKVLKGYRRTQHDYIVRKRPGTKDGVPELTAALERVLAACNLTGVTIGKLSSCPWFPPHGTRISSATPQEKKKHRATMFQLTESERYRKPFSRHWEVVSRVPTKDDVYVVLVEFDSGSFYHWHQLDQAVARETGTTLPVVYGYKDTERRPIRRDKLEGTEYSDWREAYYRDLLTPERIALIAEVFAYDICPDVSEHRRDALREVLGKDHMIYRHVMRYREASHKLKGHDKGALRTIADRHSIEMRDSLAEATQVSLGTIYPLLRKFGLSELWGSDQKLWLDYVKVIDQSLNNPHITGEENADASVHAN